MPALQLLLTLAVLAYSAYSVVTYLARRSADRGALRELQRRGQATRTLTPAEREAVGPFLVDPRRPGRAVPLLDERVFELHGQFLRHGLSGRHGAQTLHDTLAGVDVVLPYDARDHLAAANRAEVALTRRFAVVLKLNGTFDLAGGRARLQADQAAARQWEAGAPGVVESTSAAEPAETAPGDGAGMGVRVLGQRDETPAEAAARAGPGWGGLSALVLAAGAVILLVAGHAAHPAAWLAGAAALVVAALTLAWRPRRPPARQKVNRVQGPLALLTLQNPSNAAVVRTQLFLGDRFPIVLPRGWKERAAIPVDGQVDVDMRVADYSVVRLGQGLSIDEEVRRFPLVRYARHVTMAACGAALLLAAWIVHGGPGADLAHARAALGKEGPRRFTDPARVLAAPPAPGTLVELRGQGRPQLVAAQGDRPAPVERDLLRWGGAAPVVAPVQLEPELAALYDGTILQARSNALLQLAVRAQLAREGSPDAVGELPSIQVVTGLSALVRAVEKACGAGGAAEPCRRFRELLGGKLLLPEDEEPVGWEKLARRAADGTLAKGDDSGVLVGDVTGSLRGFLREIAEPAVHARYAAPLAAALSSQRGGVLLRRTSFAVKAPAAVPEDGAVSEDAAAPAPATEVAETGGDGGWPDRWEEYRKVAEPEALEPFEAAGLVIAARPEANGDLSLELDPARTAENAGPALARLAAFALGAALLAIHLPLGLSGMRRAAARRRALAQVR